MLWVLGLGLSVVWPVHPACSNVAYTLGVAIPVDDTSELIASSGGSSDQSSSLSSSSTSSSDQSSSSSLLLSSSSSSSVPVGAGLASIARSHATPTVPGLDDHGVSPEPPMPVLPPIWPPKFVIEFNETEYLGIFSLHTGGKIYYDSTNQRSRIDRDVGRGDRFCGTVWPIRRTPCSHVVVGGVRYLVFPEHRYCCQCCRASDGCGIRPRTWLANATYIGRENVEGYDCNKWKQTHKDTTNYWQVIADSTPMRIYVEPRTQLTFRHDTFKLMNSIDSDIFSLPHGYGCEQRCPGLCYITSSEGVDRVLRRYGRKVLSYLHPFLFPF
ncbi:hypothetical protein CBR_g88566 [Chara braunii]|uniref:Uncharacterized protein n=1 Tax=Chara braunii TaxID=69332 RepID=A0A388KB68_CHABU|nr:hypothetical protein CBR_g88566 [Chara braunii]|eukprot:GBG67277.1 hypothetical protein CBR_g88566 [Chara braunii]